MIILGLLLMGAAAAVTVGIIASSHDVVPITLFGHTTAAHEASVVFVAGAIAGVAFTVGLSMLLAGMTRGRHRRVDRKRTEKQRIAENKALAARNQELERSLAAERAQDTTTTAPTTGAPTTGAGTTAPATTGATATAPAPTAPATGAPIDLNERDRAYADGSRRS